VGANFTLGQTNTVNAQSILTGDAGSAAQLKVENTGGGSALAFTVNSGVTPFKVNSTTKVTNLNADLLDGLDSGKLWKLGGNAGTSPGTDFLGTTDNKALELHVNGQRALRIEPATPSPNLIGGLTNFADTGVSGATISGGGEVPFPNEVAGDFGTVGGGLDNHAFVGATVGGGTANFGLGSRSTVAGGETNVARGDGSIVGGGIENQANGLGSIVPGGESNVAAGLFSFAAGHRAKAVHDGAFVWADSTDADFASTGNDQFDVRASGGANFQANVRVTGTISREYSGTPKQATPLAYGVVSSTGAFLPGTPNVTTSFDSATKTYLIGIAAESYSSASFIAIVTPLTGVGPSFPTTATRSSKLAVTFTSVGGATVQRAFSFVVYKP
jgi:hypothetical protein